MYPSFRAGFPELKDFYPIIQIILLFPGDISLIGIISIVLSALIRAIRSICVPFLVVALSRYAAGFITAKAQSLSRHFCRLSCLRNTKLSANSGNQIVFYGYSRSTGATPHI